MRALSYAPGWGPPEMSQVDPHRSLTITGLVEVFTARIEQQIVWTLIDSARLRLRLADVAMCDQHWRTHEGPWLESSSTTESEDRWLTKMEAARRLDVQYSHVDRAVREGRLPAQRHEGRWRIKLSDVDQWEKHRIKKSRLIRKGGRPCAA